MVRRQSYTGGEQYERPSAKLAARCPSEIPDEDAFGVDELIDRVVGELEGAKPR
jgi:hypothetical protein